jgi:hypothetical protein
MVAVVKQPENIRLHFFSRRFFKLKKNRPSASARVGDIKVALFPVSLPLQIIVINNFL